MILFCDKSALVELLREAGFVHLRFERVGRVPALAKSMIAMARKPSLGEGRGTGRPAHNRPPHQH